MCAQDVANRFGILRDDRVRIVGIADDHAPSLDDLAPSRDEADLRAAAADVDAD
jgi:hypothetical protein